MRNMPLMLGVVVCLAGSASAQELTVTGQVTVLGQHGKAKRQDNSDVVVWLTPLTEVAASAPTRPDPSREGGLRILQKGKRFVPHMLIVPVGAEVEFPNLDPFFHNVFSLFEGKRFDLGLYEAGSTRKVRFDRAGVCYIFCNIHSEMGAVVIVLDTPYSAISDPAGKILIPNVSPGRYRLDVWSEKALPEELKALSRALTVGEDSTFLGHIQLSGNNQSVLQHLNKYGQAYDNPAPSSPLYDRP